MRGQDGLASQSNRTALLAFFGQVVTNEIVMASESGCPIEMHRIEIEKCDEMYDKECRGDRYIPFHRAAYDRSTGQSPNAPREQVRQQQLGCSGSRKLICTLFSDQSNDSLDRWEFHLQHI